MHLSDTVSSKWWLSAFSRSHVATRKVKLEDMDRYDSNNLETPRQPLCVDLYSSSLLVLVLVCY